MADDLTKYAYDCDHLNAVKWTIETFERVWLGKETPEDVVADAGIGPVDAAAYSYMLRADRVEDPIEHGYDPRTDLPDYYLEAITAPFSIERIAHARMNDEAAREASAVLARRSA